MSPLECFFWLCFAIVAYTYLVYPILLAFLNCFVRRERQLGSLQTSVSFLLPVHNEEANLERRLDELTRMIQASGLPGEIIVISDASTDGSVAGARQFADRGVRVLEQASKQGKAAAVNAGAAAAQYEMLIFADARQRWADDALVRLLENFADPAIGAVSGDLMLESAPGMLEGVGLYWRFEKWLRKQESRFGSQVGVTGAISAVRRPLFHPIPPGTLLDDVYWPMHVVLQGYRVVHDERAKAFDRLPDNPHDEFRRKVRTLAGNFQLLTLLPYSALLPWRNRVWWTVCFAQADAVWKVSVGKLAGDADIEHFSYERMLSGIFLCPGSGLRLGAARPDPGGSGRWRLGNCWSKPGGIVSGVVNAAAWMAFWVWATGRAGRSWHKVAMVDQTKARRNTKKRQNMIEAIVYDAVGTLIHVQPSVGAIYAGIGQRFGSRLTADEIQTRFGAAFAQQDRLDEQAEWRTDEARERRRWRDIVAQVLDDVNDPAGCFEALFAAFAQPDVWACDPDAAEVLAHFQRRGVRQAMASNFGYAAALGVRSPAMPGAGRVSTRSSSARRSAGANRRRRSSGI